MASSRGTDAELAARVRKGDSGAFETIYRAHHDFLVAFANGYLGSVDAARDIVADVFVNLWNGRATWTPTTSIQTYLCGAVRNRALNALRNDRFRDGAARAVVASTDRVPAMGDAPPSPQETLEQEERLAIVWRAVESLSPSQREAMMLRWRRQLPFEEIAPIMGISVAAVQMHLSRALKVLRQVCPAAFEGVAAAGQSGPAAEPQR